MDYVSFQSSLDGGSHRGKLPQSQWSGAYREEDLTVPGGYTVTEDLMAGNETNHSGKEVPDGPDEYAKPTIHARYARYLYDCVLELQITDLVSLELLCGALPDILETFALRLFHSDSPTPEASAFARILHDEIWLFLLIPRSLCWIDAKSLTGRLYYNS